MLTYILPLRSASPRLDLEPYLAWLSQHCAVIVVDGSAPQVFAEHRAAWGRHGLHVPVQPELRTPMGKVGGVLTGLHLARTDAVVIADDDVRYDEEGLNRMEELLDTADVVRPHNVFSSWPWHAGWDTGRSLLARCAGGDWPGTLGVRREILMSAGGYAGDVMFENLELVRTVRIAGGRELVAHDLFVLRTPPSVGHFWSQRVRHAYDEFARPGRMVTQLLILPAALLGGRRVIVGIVVVGTLAAERGRRRAGGASVIPWWTALFAPLWILERSITSWLAVVVRVVRGGVRYGDVRLRKAASSRAELRCRANARGVARRGTHAAA